LNIGQDELENVMENIMLFLL